MSGTSFLELVRIRKVGTDVLWQYLQSFFDGAWGHIQDLGARIECHVVFKKKKKDVSNPFSNWSAICCKEAALEKSAFPKSFSYIFSQKRFTVYSSWILPTLNFVTETQVDLFNMNNWECFFSVPHLWKRYWVCIGYWPLSWVRFGEEWEGAKKTVKMRRKVGKRELERRYKFRGNFWKEAKTSRI